MCCGRKDGRKDNVKRVYPQTQFAGGIIKFHYNIPKGYLVMGCAKIDLKINQTDVTPKLNKGEQPFLYESRCLNPVYIAIKFH